jgi:hypothetical protein
MKKIYSILLLTTLSLPAAAWDIFDDDDPIPQPTLIDPSIKRPTPEQLAQAEIAKAKKAKANAELKIKREQTRLKQLHLEKVAEEKRLADIAAEKKRNASIYTMTKGQNYYDVLTTWLTPLVTSTHNTEKQQYHGITWQLPAATIKKLKNRQAEKDMTLNKKLAIAVSEMGTSIDTDLTLTLSNQHKIAVIAEHKMTVVWVHGDTLKNAVENLAIQFNWHWLDNGKSWLAAHDFPFSSNYPIAVKAGDFNTALNSVIDGYPLQAKLLNGTRTIYITDK